MTDKLQELTDRLYQEGLAKGKEEGDRYLAEAKKRAGEIIDQANAQAAEILSKAAGQARELKDKAEADIKMASAQALQATRHDIENLMVGSIASEGVKASLADKDFIKQIILAVAEKFSAEQSEDLALVLPENLRSELEPFVAGELKQKLGKGVDATFSKKVAGGFTIGPKDGSYFISLTDESFSTLIGEYLRPVTKKLLFG